MRSEEKLKALREHPHSDVTKISKAVYFLNQAYTTHCHNYLQMQECRGELEYLIDCAPAKGAKRKNKRLKTINRIHNYLSSYYSLKESVTESFKDIPTDLGNLAATSNHIYQEYVDDTAFILAMRTFVQHRQPLDLEWIIEYSHSKSMYEYQIGFWLSDLGDAGIEWKDETDAEGNHHEGIEYYFGDVEGPFVDFFKQARESIKRTEEFYYESVERITEHAEEEIEAVDSKTVEQLEEIAFDVPDEFDSI